MSQEKNRLARLFGSAVFSQAVLSAAGLLSGLLLIRFATDTQYGYYVLVTTALVLLTGAQSAFVNSPMAIVWPKLGSPDERRVFMSGLFAGVRRFWAVLALLVVAVTLILTLLGVQPSANAWLAAALAAAAAMSTRREFLRQSVILLGRMRSLVRSDVLYAVLLVVGAGVACLMPESTVAVTAIFLMALSAAGGALLLRREISTDPGLVDAPMQPAYARILHLSGWATAGSMIQWASTQGFYYVIALRLDAAAVAAIAATRLLMMPVNLIGTGVGQTLFPMASRWLHEEGFSPLVRRLLLGAALMAGIVLAYCGVLWVLRHWITGTLMGKHIADLDRLVLLWSFIFLVGLVRNVVMTAVLAQGRFRSMTWLALASAVLSLGFSFWGLEHHGASGALIGLAVAETFNFAGVIVLMITGRRIMPPPVSKGAEGVRA